MSIISKILDKEYKEQQININATATEYRQLMPWSEFFIILSLSSVALFLLIIGGFLAFSVILKSISS